MDIEKQREIIRLWNRMRRVEGPIAEEIRIQILEYFAQQDRTKRAACCGSLSRAGKVAASKRCRRQRDCTDIIERLPPLLDCLIAWATGKPGPDR